MADAALVVGFTGLRKAASASRWGGVFIAAGSLGVVATSILYGISPPAAAMPAVALDLGAAARGAVAGATTMHLAGLFGIFADVAITAGGLALGVERLVRDEGVAAIGWFLIATSTILFAVVDAMVGFVLSPVAAATGASQAFLLAKRLFDVLFLLGTATFGAGAMLAVARSIVSGAVSRPLAILGFAAGLCGAVAATACLLGVNLTPFLGGGLLGGSLIFALIGAQIAFKRS